MPRVSVIIPAYNHARFICESIESVLRQTFTDYEVIVVNDGSPDDTTEVLRPFLDRKQIIYIEQANAGQAAARNRGIREAKGEYIALLDDDDCWPPNKLAWQVACMDGNQNINLVGGGMSGDPSTLLRDQGEPLSSPCVATFESIIAWNPFTSPGQTLIRKSAIDAIAGFREEVWGADDWDLYLRLSRMGRVEIYTRPALFYRRHGDNASGNMVRLLRNALSVLHDHLLTLAPADRSEHYAKSLRWMYSFGLRVLLSEIKQHLRKRNISGLVSGVVELFRRLAVLGFDPVVLRALRRDCFQEAFGMNVGK